MALYDAFGNLVFTSDGPWSESYHWNLIDPSKVTKEGQYYYSDLVPVVEGELLHWLWSNADFFAADKTTLIESVTGAGIASYGGKYTVPSGAAYGRWKASSASFNVYRNGYGRHDLKYNSEVAYDESVPMFAENVNIKGWRGYAGVLPWIDKRIAVIGDSFSAPGTWQRKMCENFGAICDNHSISGGGWCTGRTKTVYELANEITETPDIIIIAIGLNDSGTISTGSTSNIGEIINGTSVDNYSDTTFIGGMQKALTYIQNRFVGVPVYVGWTPAGARSDTDVEAYIEAMKAVCIKHQAVYIETRACGMAYPLIQETLRYRRNSGDMHPSDEGQLQIARYMTDIMSGYMGVR